MPSSGKTSSLQLNKWLGSDKPKKDDFNTDNQKLDDANAALLANITQIGQNLSAHSSGTTQHITQSERTAWNAKDQFTLSSYQGNGANTRKLELGFNARFGFVFGVSRGLIKTGYDESNSEVYSGMFSSLGCSDGVTSDSTGFTVTNHPIMRPNGFTIKLNETGVSYVYIAWK